MGEEHPVFVLAWVTANGALPTPMGEGGEVLFVEHPQRGWEIPGGHLEDNESPEEALMRELREETGLDGTLVSWNKAYYPKGWVAHVTVAQTHRESWTVGDDNVQSVKWWKETPPVIEWTPEEFEDLAVHFSRS
ncbi:MAG: hypothetical protein CMA86_01830 [Euryarchaeota archaeon]|nr:hypothetical protein [Euryarchaeota archaeon]